MAYCIVGIPTSIIVGKYLDKTKCYRKMIIMIAITISLFITLTFVGLHLKLNHTLVLGIIILTGGPMFSVNVPTFQFVAEVIYPVSEIQGVSMINVINKLITFGFVKLQNYTNSLWKSADFTFYVWIALSLLGLIPAFLVKEDLRRLNMKNVDKSAYFEDHFLMNQPRDRRNAELANRKIIAAQEVIDELDLSDLYNLDIN
jgi:predicted MFS family arabinose efflux permease